MGGGVVCDALRRSYRPLHCEEKMRWGGGWWWAQDGDACCYYPEAELLCLLPVPCLRQASARLLWGACALTRGLFSISPQM